MLCTICMCVYINKSNTFFVIYTCMCVYLYIHNKYIPYTHIVCKHELNVSKCDYWFAAECSLIMNLNVINVSNSAFRDLCTKGTSSEMNGHVSVKEQECGVIIKCVWFLHNYLTKCIVCHGFEPNMCKYCDLVMLYLDEKCKLCH